LSIHLEVSEIRSEKILALHRWWQSHCHADIPDRSDLNPTDIKCLLPNLLISDVEPCPFRIRYRLVGTTVVDATGFDFTGRYLDELMPGDADEPWMEDYRRAYALRAPLFGIASAPTTMDVRYSYEFALFPLRKGGSDVRQFVSVEDYFDFRMKAGEWEQWGLQTFQERPALAG
jgi:hypothetical protein